MIPSARRLAPGASFPPLSKRVMIAAVFVYPNFRSSGWTRSVGEPVAPPKLLPPSSATSGGRR